MEQKRDVIRTITNTYREPITIYSDYFQINKAKLFPDETVILPLSIPEEYSLYEFEIIEDRRVVGVYIGLVLREFLET